jgi:hypothetical protein
VNTRFKNRLKSLPAAACALVLAFSASVQAQPDVRDGLKAVSLSATSKLALGDRQATSVSTGAQMRDDEVGPSMGTGRHVGVSEFATSKASESAAPSSEPQPYSLALAGLAAVCFVAMRRRPG